MNNLNQTYKPYITLVLLCLGYFIDFYDLSIMGSSFNELIREQFNIQTTTGIQQTYLLISNFQTLGILVGSLIFGYLGDRYGRALIIRYSILIYSISTILAVYTHNLEIFIFLRFMAYIGLATEFSTSMVLICEMFTPKKAAWGSALLYSTGVLGGLCATFISIFSWQAMFLFGGIGGLLLYIARSKIQESLVYLNAKSTSLEPFGAILKLFLHKEHIGKIIKYTLMILPFNVIITTMFIMPGFMVHDSNIGMLTKTLLIGFFTGNIISSFITAFYKQLFKDFKLYMLLSIGLFIVLMLNFTSVNKTYFFLFALGLGLCGGGYPVVWGQLIANDFPVQVRSSASNTLFALGRTSSIIFNLLISLWLSQGSFVTNTFILGAIIGSLAIISIFFTRCKQNSIITN